MHERPACQRPIKELLIRRDSRWDGIPAHPVVSVDHWEGALDVLNNEFELPALVLGELPRERPNRRVFDVDLVPELIAVGP